MNINKLSWIRGVLFAMRKTPTDQPLYYGVLRAWFQFSDEDTSLSISSEDHYRVLGLAAELVVLYPDVEMYQVIMWTLGDLPYWR